MKWNKVEWKRELNQSEMNERTWWVKRVRHERSKMKRSKVKRRKRALHLPFFLFIFFLFVSFVSDEWAVGVGCFVVFFLMKRTTHAFSSLLCRAFFSLIKHKENNSKSSITVLFSFLFLHCWFHSVLFHYKSTVKKGKRRAHIQLPNCYLCLRLTGVFLSCSFRLIQL